MSELREALIEALVDDAWEGHGEPLTRADLAAIADALIAGPLAPILAERDEAQMERADALRERDEANRKLDAVRALTDEIEHSEWGLTSGEAILRLRRILDAAMPDGEGESDV